MNVTGKTRDALAIVARAPAHGIAPIEFAAAMWPGRPALYVTRPAASYLARLLEAGFVRLAPGCTAESPRYHITKLGHEARSRRWLRKVPFVDALFRARARKGNRR